jgi:hypothetical protein
MGRSRYAGRMASDLTAQQRERRCTFGRYLAWWTLDYATCCGCVRSPQECCCQPTNNPDEGCLGIDFGQVAKPEDEDPECE